MNEQTNKMIEQLAQKLGTTTEYLWSVLLKQAPIDATINLLQILFVILFGWALFKTHRKFLKDVETEEGYYRQNAYELYGFALQMPMGLSSVIFFLLLITSFFSIENIFNGYCNPEYWALMKILKTIK